MLSDEINRLKDGVNVIGYFQGQFGLGETARLMVSALEKQSIPFCLLSADAVVRQQTRRPYDRACEQKPKYAVNVFCIDAHALLPFLRHAGVDLLKDRYNIILFFWRQISSLRGD